ncbi:hypothetical protein [Paenibacillus pini]|uniref:Integrase catalytic domain-containing protein n=1 Tax=Paenibacillus pini JCM 16418 TaxID=1236976 RepID=W7YFY0_9BACL|nr:hypothetical protein [Paenibacillus pini]GAF07377.1 hypothetical protein JCM16418_1393 [Paenibacillus pini JCM 16418]
MSRIRFIENACYTNDDLDYNKWPDVHIDQRNQIFESRKKAVQLYMDGNLSLENITTITGITRKQLYKLARKCLERDEHGHLWGFRALLPYRRTGEKYIRLAQTNGFKKDTRLTGAFKQLLERYPELRELIHDYILNRKRRSIVDRIIRIKDLRTKFLKLARSLEIELNEYPFNTNDKGLRSLYRYVENLITNNAAESSFRFGEEGDRRLNRFDGKESTKDYNVVPYHSVQIDGHKIDVVLTVKFTNAYGDEVSEVMSRIWLLLIIDEATRAVLGYHLCLNREYSSYDVLHTIKNAVVPWKPMDFTIPGLCYPDMPCYPSALLPETEWAVWNELKCDNAMANISNVVEDRLTKIIKCSVNPGQAQYPEGRAIIERFFGLLESNYIHRIGMTTGSHPKDPRRNSPEKIAKKYVFRAEELEQLIEIAIATYNTSLHSSLGISPLEAMEQRMKYQDMIPRQLSEQERVEANFFSLQTTRVVQGNKKTGKRPHINYEGVPYSSTLLARNFSLIGEKLIVEVNIDDISILKVYLPDGQELDYLKAKGPWGRRPHTLRTRKTINKLVREDKLKFDDVTSPIDALESWLEENSTSYKKPRNELATLQRYKQKSLPPVETVDELTTVLDDEITIDTTSNDKAIELEELRKRFKTNC